MLGSQRDGGERGVAEWRRAVVMSHLLRADRMATESWHVPHSHEKGVGELNAWEGKKDFVSKHTFICEGCAVFIT